MIDSGSFVVDALACALLVIALWVACAGVGLPLLPRPSVSVEEQPASWRQAGVAACVGLGVLTAFGGVAVVLRIPWWLVVFPFLGIGLFLAIRTVGRVDLRAHSGSVLAITAVGIAAFIFVAIAEAPVGLRFPLNVCDDLRAYLPFAHRLLDTYGLEEPWSHRASQSLGGFDLLRALPVAAFGNVGIGVVETVFASVFLAGLFVANGVRSGWARLVSAGLALGVLFVWVPRNNTSGTLMAVPLIVAVLGITVELRESLRGQRLGNALRWSVAGGVVTALLTSVRPNFGFLAALLLGVGALTTRNSRITERAKACGVAAISAAIAMAPWSFASWRTAGTPLYPLLAGNFNEGPSRAAPLSGVPRLLELAWHLVSTGPYLWMCLSVAVVAIVARSYLPDAFFTCAAALTVVAVTVAFALTTPWLAVGTFLRYNAPMSGAVAVFLICEALRAADTGTVESRLARRRVGSLLVFASSVAIAAITFSVFGFRATTFPGGIQLVKIAAGNESRPPTLTTRELRTAYAQALDQASDGRTIVAVDRPYLIDYTRYDVPSLDIPGYVTPDGRPFPYATGPQSKISFLRDYGFDTLIVTDPESDLCMSPNRIHGAILDDPAKRRRYRRVVDWLNDLAAIRKRAPNSVRAVGPLFVIDLTAARAEFLRSRATSPAP
jgi:hypothetical protein